VPICLAVRHERFQSFLLGQVLLVALLGATLAFFLRYPSLRTPYALPGLRLVLATVFALGSGLIALLAGTRFTVEGRRFDLLLCGGFLVSSLSWLVFTVLPGIAGDAALLAGAAGSALGWTLITIAPYAQGRVHRRRLALAVLVAGACLLMPVVWLAHRGTSGTPLTGVLALQALLQLHAAIAFGDRYRRHAEDLDQWLSVVASLTLFATLGRIFTPHAAPPEVARGDFLVLIAQGVVLLGLWRAMRAAEFGRAVAEERARVARDIHDGLAQYLFTISAGAAVLEAGGDLDGTLPRIKEAALAAQQEARYAILALSSAAGRAPFDAALRRFVDMLTADGALDVDLEIDSSIALGPDEQIEIFRIVQEGLANARRHAGARRAWVEIGERAGARVIALRDDGRGFAPGEAEAGQGLRNMRDRAAAIGAALSLRSVPGRGTSLEVVLRA
jgi:signal transduction histidine kinase